MSLTTRVQAMPLYNKILKVCNKESSCVQFNFQGRITSLNHTIITPIHKRVELEGLFFPFSVKTSQDIQVGKGMNHPQTAFNNIIKAPLSPFLHLKQARKKRQMLNLTLLPRSYCQPNTVRSHDIVNQLLHSSSTEHFQGMSNQGKIKTPSGDVNQMKNQKEKTYENYQPSNKSEGY